MYPSLQRKPHEHLEIWGHAMWEIVLVKSSSPDLTLFQRCTDAGINAGGLF